MPNAGKSTLLKTLTNANPKIGDYPFTTLHPNLGMLKFIDREIVIADIPGLIEGASEGTGLGHTFLRHVSRTKLMLHLIEVTSQSIEDCLNNYTIIENELEKYDQALSKEKKLLIYLKSISFQLINKEFIQAFQELGTIRLISSATQFGIENLKKDVLHYINHTEDA